MNNKEMNSMGAILSASSAYWQSSTIHAAVRLELFTVMGGDEWSVSEASEAIKGSERGVRALLNALTAMNLLTRNGDRYCATREARELLGKNSPHYIGHIIKHHHHLVDGWAQLDEAVLSGKPVTKRSYGEDAERESFLLGMHNIAMGNASSAAKAVPLQGCRRLLDLGGGPGTYAIYFCKEYPDLAATIFDRPTTRPFAEKTVASHGLSNRISFVAGDFALDPLPGGYNAIWASQILHSYGPEECRQILRKCWTALEPGGMLLIHEFFLNDSLDGPLFPALFSLNMLLNNESGRSYSEEEVAIMLAGEGFEQIEWLANFHGSNDSYIITGKRPE